MINDDQNKKKYTKIKNIKTKITKHKKRQKNPKT